MNGFKISAMAILLLIFVGGTGMGQLGELQLEQPSAP